MRNLPLATLRTFEAAARYKSLAKAACELNLTHSAVSHQLRRLEESLGVALFEKAGRGVALTDAGRTFARSISIALRDIKRAAQGLIDADLVGGRLILACPPMFASKWLAKHLAEFCNAHPAIELEIKLVDNSRVFAEPDVDLAVQFGEGSWPGKWSTLLANVSIAPACSPRLFEKAGLIFKSPEDLRNTCLLHQDDGAEWRRWLAESGQHDYDRFSCHLYCSDLSIAIDLALEGTGTVLVSDVLSSSYVAEGTLIRPFQGSILASGGWFALCDPYKLEQSKAKLFLSWLLGRFGQTFTAGAGRADVDVFLDH